PIRARRPRQHDQPPGRTVSRLGPLFAPRGIAVVGASRDPAKLGAVMARSLRRFPGPVAGGNPRAPDPAAGPHAGYQHDLVTAARTAGVALLGPNTSGFFVPRQDLIASFVPGAAAVEA